MTFGLEVQDYVRVKATGQLAQITAIEDSGKFPADLQIAIKNELNLFPYDYTTIKLRADEVERIPRIEQDPDFSLRDYLK